MQKFKGFDSAIEFNTHDHFYTKTHIFTSSKVMGQSTNQHLYGQQWSTLSLFYDKFSRFMVRLMIFILSIEPAFGSSLQKHSTWDPKNKWRRLLVGLTKLTRSPKTLGKHLLKLKRMTIQFFFNKGKQTNKIHLHNTQPCHEHSKGGGHSLANVYKQEVPNQKARL